MKALSSSMQLTRAADYAVRVMIHLATAETNARLSLPDLARATDAPESFLSKVLQALAHAGLISSRRGQSGGFVLTATGARATMRQVVEAVDGPVRLNVCLAPGPSCHRKSWCPAHGVWARAQQAMLDVLDNATIASLAAEMAQEDTAPASLCTICLSAEVLG
jgi:Rrf2 family protein